MFFFPQNRWSWETYRRSYLLGINSWSWTYKNCLNSTEEAWFFLLEKTNGENNWPRPICVEIINVNPDRTREILLWQLTFDCFIFFSESSMSNSNNSQRIRLIERIEQAQLIDLSKIIINKSDLMLLKTKWHANDWIVFFDVKSSLSGFNYWNLVDLGPSSRVARWWLRRHENRCMARLGCPLLAGHKRRGGFRGLESWG